MHNIKKAPNKEIKEFVRKRYAQFAVDPSSCRGPATSPAAYSRVRAIGYTPEELEALPASVIESAAGCGNPADLADLKEGEVVLDLGSGGGIDVFLAAKRVGPKGRVIGVDMTPEMIKKARENAKKMGLGNVEFKLGEIERLPVEDDFVDVVLSNCVINLSPSKDKVFKEAYRVLRHGGRMVISDIVTQGKLPKTIRESKDAWAACIAGALEEGEYLECIRRAGFRNICVLSRGTSCCGPMPEKIYSLKVKAIKP